MHSRTLFIWVLKAGKSKIKVPSGLVSVEDPLLVHRWPYSPYDFTWQEGQGSFIESLFAFKNIPPLPKHSPKNSSPITIILEIRFQHMNFEGKPIFSLEQLVTIQLPHILRSRQLPTVWILVQCLPELTNVSLNSRQTYMKLGKFTESLWCAISVFVKWDK